MTRLLPSGTAPLAELAPFAEIRLIALDVDGTLLSPKAEEPGTLVTALRTLPHYRYKVGITIATGRAYAGALPAIKSLNPSQLFPIIIYNGSVTVNLVTNRVLDRHIISQDLVLQINEVASAHELHSLVYECTPTVPMGLGSHPSRHAPPVLEWVSGFGQEKGRTWVKDPNGLNISWSHQSYQAAMDGATAVIIPTAGRAKAANNARRELHGINGISVTASGPQYIEIRPNGVDKSTALQHLAVRLGITQKQIAAVGDSENDVEMLRWAGCGVCVADASQRAIDASDFLSRYNGSGGVVELLQTIRQARRYLGDTSPRPGHLA